MIFFSKKIFSQQAFWLLLICVLFLGCKDDDLSKNAEKLSENYKSWIDKFNSLRSNLESKGCLEQTEEAEGLRNKLAEDNSDIQNKIADNFITNDMLAGLKEKLTNYEKQYETLQKECTKPKDDDDDGVPDNVDECAKAGIKPHGCPDPDGDGFYTNDARTKVDKCPNDAGVAPNGCKEKTTIDVTQTGSNNRPKKPENVDTDGDGVPDYLDECVNDFGRKDLNGCIDEDGDGVYTNDAKTKVDVCPKKPGDKPHGCPDSDEDGVHDGIDMCVDYGQLPNGCPCKQDFSPLKFKVDCKVETKTGNLNLMPNVDVMLKDFWLIGSSSGDITYSLINKSSGRTLLKNNSFLNTGPSQTQILTSNKVLKKGFQYELIVETIDDNLFLVADDCTNKNISTANLQMDFKNAAFIHRINFCK